MDISLHFVESVSVQTIHWDDPDLGKYTSHKIKFVVQKPYGLGGAIEEFTIYPNAINADRISRAFEAFNAVMNGTDAPAADAAIEPVAPHSEEAA